MDTSRRWRVGQRKGRQTHPILGNLEFHRRFPCALTQRGLSKLRIGLSLPLKARKFLHGTAPGAISDDSPLASTEDDFKAAGVSGDAELTNTVTNEIQNLRGLADHITTAAKAEKDPAVARPMLKQLEACCVYLLTNERAQFIQLVGEALQTTNQKQLEQLPSEQ